MHTRHFSGEKNRQGYRLPFFQHGIKGVLPVCAAGTILAVIENQCLTQIVHEQKNYGTENLLQDKGLL